MESACRDRNSSLATRSSWKSCGTQHGFQPQGWATSRTQCGFQLRQPGQAGKLWNPARVPATGAGHKQNPAWVPPKMAGRSNKTHQMNKTKIYKKKTKKAPERHPKSTQSDPKVTQIGTTLDQNGLKIVLKSTK